MTGINHYLRTLHPYAPFQYRKIPFIFSTITKCVNYVNTIINYIIIKVMIPDNTIIFWYYIGNGNMVCFHTYFIVCFTLHIYFSYIDGKFNIIAIWNISLNNIIFSSWFLLLPQSKKAEREKHKNLNCTVEIWHIIFILKTHNFHSYGTVPYYSVRYYQFGLAVQRK